MTNAVENKSAKEAKAEVKSTKAVEAKADAKETRKVVVDLPASELDNFKELASLLNQTQGEFITKVIVNTLEKNKDLIAQHVALRKSVQF